MGIERMVTEGGIKVERRTNEKGSPISVTEEITEGGMRFWASKHVSDGTIVFNINRHGEQGEIFTSFGMHLTKEQSQALGSMLRRMGDL